MTILVSSLSQPYGNVYRSCRTLLNWEINNTEVNSNAFTHTSRRRFRYEVKALIVSLSIEATASDEREERLAKTHASDHLFDWQFQDQWVACPAPSRFVTCHPTDSSHKDRGWMYHTSTQLSFVRVQKTLAIRIENSSAIASSAIFGYLLSHTTNGSLLQKCTGIFPPDRPPGLHRIKT